MFTSFEEEARNVIEKEYELQYEGLDDYNNPFQSWAQEIYDKSKRSISEGTGIDPMYLPTLVPIIIKCVKLLPLWSGLMIPILGYGSETASSAAIESSFNKTKNITFKNISLPTDIETFLEHHISSLRGASLLRTSQQIFTTNPLAQSNHEITITSPRIKNISIGINNVDDDTLLIRETDCPLCKTGNLPSQQGLHKCTICKVPVHALSSCSTHISGEEEKRVCFLCSDINKAPEVDNILKEDKSVENWNKRPAKLQTSRSYLQPNSSLQYLRINNSKIHNYYQF